MICNAPTKCCAFQMMVPASASESQPHDLWVYTTLVKTQDAHGNPVPAHSPAFVSYAGSNDPTTLREIHAYPRTRDDGVQDGVVVELTATARLLDGDAHNIVLMQCGADSYSEPIAYGHETPPCEHPPKKL